MSPRVFPVFLVIFAILIPPALYGYNKTTDEVYYDMGQCLPEDMEYVIANSKLSEEFDIASTHMVLVNAKMPARDVRAMMDEMEQVDGVKYVLRTGIRHRHAGAGGDPAGQHPEHPQERPLGAVADQLRVQGRQRRGQSSRSPSLNCPS